jgi:hypothetical protein
MNINLGSATAARGLKYYLLRHSPMPEGNTKLDRFWRRAPAVRFISLAIFTTGVLAFECVFS